MKFALFDHAGKGTYLGRVLAAAGHTPCERPDEADLLLLDCDWSWAHPRSAMIDAAKTAGARVALYPHGGMPTVFVYDGLTDPHPGVDLRLEHGQGSIEIARIFGAESRLSQHAPGWLFSPTAPPATPSGGRPGRVLFAPMHPNIEALQARTNGNDPAPKLNQDIYKQLLAMHVDLTVSIVAPPDRNGIWQHPRATFVDNPSMNFQASYDLVRQADAVVAAGTIGALGVALGKPTVMFGQGDWSDYVGGRYVKAKHAKKYASMARYPIDCSDTPVEEALARACEGDRTVAEWREAFIGHDDGASAAVRLLEQLVGEPLPEQANLQQNVSIGGVTATAGAVA